MITRADDFNLRSHNTMRMSATARRWLEFSSRVDLPDVADILNERPDEPFIIVGEGSNILFTSDIFPGTVAHSNILDLDITHSGRGRVDVRAGSGIRMDEIVERTTAAGFWGMENLSLIPGEVGASAVQNVGAYGCEAADIISKVEAFDLVAGRFVSFSPQDCRFDYRMSIFKQPEYRRRFIIIAVTFTLSSHPNPRLGYGNLAHAVEALGEGVTPSTVRRAVISTRESKLPDPALIGSAGSYFTNPVVSKAEAEHFMARARALTGPDVNIPAYEVGSSKIKLSAAWLIDRAGLKGSRCGGAALWPSQPLVIVNESGQAAPGDVLALEEHIVATVKEAFGITLTPEVEKA